MEPLPAGRQDLRTFVEKKFTQLGAHSNFRVDAPDAGELNMCHPSEH